MGSIFRLLIISLSLGLFSSSLAQLDSLGRLGANNNRPVPLPVDQAFHYFLSATDAGNYRLDFQLQPEHYLYRHAFAFKWRPESTGELSVLEFTLPEGLAKTDQFFGAVEVYYDELQVQLQLPASSAGGELLIEYQGCADWGFCYPPQQDIIDLAL